MNKVQIGQTMESFVKDLNGAFTLKDHKYLHQYTNINSLSKTINDMYPIVNFLGLGYDKILNIGTGTGIFEYIAKLNDLNISTVEVQEEPDKAVNSWIRDYFGITVNYWSTDFKDYQIDCDKQFDCALVSRFGPFQGYCTNEQIDQFFKELFRLVPEVVVTDLALDPSVRSYLETNGTKLRYVYLINDSI